MDRSVATLSVMDDKLKKENEGEGSKSADKKYRDAASDFARRNDTVKAGLDAEREVEQRKGEFDKAEQEGRSHSKGDLEEDVQGSDFEKI
jgi:multidrug resistance efflux pump